MKEVNTNAAMLSSAEAMQFMIEEAKKQGKIITVKDIMEEIVANPNGNTANYFKKLLTTGYNAIMDLVENNQK